MPALREPASVLCSMVFMLTALYPVMSAAQQSTEVIELYNRNGHEIAKTIRPLLAPPDTLTATDNILIIKASSDKIAELRSIVSKLDSPLRQLLITVKQVGQEERNQQSVDVDGRVSIGNHGEIISGDSRRLPPDTVRGQVEHSLRKQATTSTQNVRVVEGREAVIYIGRSIPVYQTDRSGRGRDIAGYRDVLTGFSVLPEVSGQTYTLQISPQQETVTNARGQMVDVQRVNTVVTGRLGEWVDIGGITQQQSSSSRGILSSGKGSRQQDSSVLIKVEELKNR